MNSKFLLSCFACLLYQLVLAQSVPQVVLQKAHKHLSYKDKPASIRAVSEDDQWVITSSNEDHSIVVWNVKTAKIYARYGYTEDISSIRFIEGNEAVIINRSVVFNIHTGKIIRSLFDQGGAGSSYAVTYQYDVFPNDYIPVISIKNSYCDSLSIIYKPFSFSSPQHFVNKDSTRFWGYLGERVYEYDLLRRKVTRTIDVNGGKIQAILLNENNHLLCISTETSTALFDLAAGKTVKTIPVPLINLQLNSDASFLAGHNLSGTKTRLEIWKTASASRVTFFTMRAEGENLRAVFKSRDTVIIISEDNEPTDKNFAEAWSLLPFKKIWRNTALIDYIVSKNGSYLVGHSYDETRIVNLQDFSEPLLAKKLTIESAAISPDEQLMLTWEGDYSHPTPILYQLPTFQPIPFNLGEWKTSLHYRYPSDISTLFSNDSRRIVIYTTEDSALVCYDIKDQKAITAPIAKGYYGRRLAYSIDGRFLVDHLRNNEMLYDASNFRYIPTSGGEKEELRFALPSGQKLFRLSEKKDRSHSVSVATTVTGEIAIHDLPEHLSGFTSNTEGSLMAYTRWKVVNNTTVYEAVIADVQTGRITDSVSMPDKQETYNAMLCFSRDNNLLYIGWDQLYRYDRNSKAIVSIQPSLAGRYFPMMESPDGQILFAYRITEQDSCFIASLATKQSLVKAIYPSRANLHWLTDFSSCYNDPDPYTFGYDIDYKEGFISARENTGKGRDRIGGGYNKIISADGSKTYTYSEYDGLQVFSNNTGRLLNSIIPYEYGQVFFTNNYRYAYSIYESDGNIAEVYDIAKGFRKVPFIYTVGKDREYRFFNDQPFHYAQSMALSDSGKYLYTIDTYQEGIAKVFDFETGQLVFSLQMPEIFDNKSAPGIDYPRIYNVQMSPNEKQFIFDTYRQFLVKADVQTKVVTRLSYPVKAIMRTEVSAKGDWIAAIEDDYNKSQLKLFLWNVKGERKEVSVAVKQEDYNKLNIHIYEQQQLLAVEKADGLYFFTLNNLSYRQAILNPTIQNYSVDAATGILRVKATDNSYAWQLPSFEPVIYTSAKGYLFSWDGTQQYIYHDTTEIARLLLDKTNGQLLWMTPSGYYSLNKGSADAVGFRYLNNIYPAAAFDAVYNRPDTVFAMLQPVFHFPDELIANYKEAYATRGKRIKTTIPAGAVIPELSVQFPETVAPGSQQVTVSVNASGTNPLQHVAVTVNGVPLFGKKGKALSGNHYQSTFSIPVLPGNNEISIAVTDITGLGSLPATAHIYQHDSASYHSQTYLYGIGVSQYLDTDYTLRYADQDIRNFSKLMQQKSSSIIIDTLLNSRATRDNILALRKKLLQTKPEDKVILFFSGHGVRSKEYYLGTWDIDMGEPANKGLFIDDLYGLVDSIPAMARLIMLDACNSGQDYGEDSSKGDYGQPLAGNVKAYAGSKGVSVESDSVNRNYAIADIMDEVFADYSNEYGANVIAAAKGSEYALETGILKAGVFTYAVIDAINTGIFDEQDTKAGRAITVKELKEYVTDLVYRLTAGKQKPTSRNENARMDWRLW